MVYAIKILNPSIFVAENVDGLAQNYKGELLEQIYNDFSLNYHVEYRIVDAADFGVPQHRRRIIFIGTNLSKKIEWPFPTHLAKVRNGEFLSKDMIKSDYGLFAPKLDPALTVREAIGDLVNQQINIQDQVTVQKFRKDDENIIRHIGAGQKLCNVRFSPTSVYTWNIPEVFGTVSEKEVMVLEIIAKNRRKKIYGSIPNGNPLSIEAIQKLINFQLNINDLKELEKKGYLKDVDGKYDIKGAMFCSGLYKRPLWDEPSPTILTVFCNPRYMLHPSENRALTIRECARLQSFPDTFHFLASGISIEDSYRLIGNAVAPKLAFQIASNVLRLLTPKNKYETPPTYKRQRHLAERV